MLSKRLQQLVIISLVMLLGVSACGGGPTLTPLPTSTPEPEATPQPEAPFTTANITFGQFNLESYWYSRYILSRHHARSGFGVHMLHGPLFESDPEALQSTVKQFSETTGHAVPTNPWPVFLEFKNGQPFFTQTPDQADFATLRWDRETFDRTIETGALGQAATKKVVWIEQFLRAIYDPPENRFIGLVLTGEVLSTFNWLRTQATNTGEPLDPADYQGEYFPHAFSLELEPQEAPDGTPLPPKPTDVSISNPDSVLADQWALLWATTEFKSLTEDEETQQFFDGEPFPAEVQRLSTGLSLALFRNIQARHWNADAGTLIDRNLGGEEMGTQITTAEAARALNGLANFYQAFQGAAQAAEAQTIIDRQAQFLVELQAEDGRFPNAYDVQAAERDGSATTLVTQAEAISGLLVAADVTGNDTYEAAALRGFDWMHQNLWDEEHGLYKNSVQANTYRYTPWEIGAVVGASRGIMLHGDDLAGHLLVRFWNQAVNKSGMIQAELAKTGEEVGDGQPDSDGDGIPEPGEASRVEEAQHGVDAVLAGAVEFDPASGQWTVSDRSYTTEGQMYAANQMYITGIPTFAPPMAQALELRSLGPEIKSQLLEPGEAFQQHQDLLSGLEDAE